MPVRRHPVAVSPVRDPLANLPLDLALVERLKATYALVRVRETRLAELFYTRLFAAAPGVRAMFKSSPMEQAKKLTDALDAVVRNLEQPAQNAAMLAELGRRHAEYGAKPEHYTLVIDLLVESMREVLGEVVGEGRGSERKEASGETIGGGIGGANVAALEEWRMALRLISDQMILAGATR